MAFSKQDALEVIQREREFICGVSDRIWEHPETAFIENASTDILCKALEEKGFKVERNVADIATAFTGTWGSGAPVIGFLGEYDALSGLSQESGVPERHEVEPGGCGHGCGHNLLGAGCLASVMAVKEYLEKTGRPGTVIFYGCPGEEGGSGKAFMARDGVFDGVDCAFSWHPQTHNHVSLNSSLANCQVYYRFHGVSSHAAAAPHLGRSALDACEIMNICVQFLREHVTPDVRMHYAITNPGGYSPNVVQSYAEVLYLLRGKDAKTVQGVYERVNKIAEAAALATETTVERDFVKGCSNVIPNLVLAQLVHKNLQEVKGPDITEADKAGAKKFTDSVADVARADPEVIFNKIVGDSALRQELYEKHRDDPLYLFLPPVDMREAVDPGSTDVGDVSWVCPTVMFYVTTEAFGTPGHSWQFVAQGKSHWAHEGMLYAGRAMAGAAIDLIEDPELLKKAKEDFKARTHGEKYAPPIPKGVRPRSLG